MPDSSKPSRIAQAIKLKRRSSRLCGAVGVVAQRLIAIVFVDLTAGKNEGAGGEIDLVMSLHHEYFDTVCAVPEQQNCRRRRAVKLVFWLQTSIVPSCFKS